MSQNRHKKNFGELQSFFGDWRGEVFDLRFKGGYTLYTNRVWFYCVVFITIQYV